MLSPIPPQSSRWAILLSIALVIVSGTLLQAQQPPEPKFLLDQPNAEITHFVYSPDGTYLATVTAEEINVWDANTGKHISTISKKWPLYSESEASFTRDNRYLATCGRDTVLVFDVASATLAKEIPFSNSNAVAFSPDGKWLAAGSRSYDKKPGSIVIWNATTWEMARAISEIPAGRAKQVVFSPDSRLITSAPDARDDGDEVKLWDSTTGAVVRALKCPKAHLVAFSADNRYIAILSRYKNLDILDASTGALVRSLPYKDEDITVRQLAFGKNGLLAVSAFRGTHSDVRLWDVSAGRLLSTVKFENDPNYIIAISPDQRWLTIRCERYQGTLTTDSVARWELSGLAAGNNRVLSYEKNLELTSTPVQEAALHPTDTGTPLAESRTPAGNLNGWSFESTPTIQRLTTKPEGATSLSSRRRRFQYLQITARVRNGSSSAQPIISPTGAIYLSRGSESYLLQDLLWPGKKEVAGLIGMLQGGELNLQGPGYTLRFESRDGNQSTVLSVNAGATVELSFLFQVPEDATDAQLKFQFLGGVTLALAGPSGPTVVAAAPSAPAKTFGVAMFRGNLQRTGAENTKLGQGKPVLKWKYKLGPIVASPVIAGDTVFVASDKGQVAALDLASGNVRWSANAKSPVYATPAVEDGKVLVASDGGTLFAFDAESGREIWRYNSPPGVKLWASPAVIEGVVYAGSLAGEMYMLDIQTGQAKGHSSFYAPISSPVAVSNNVIYMMTWDKDLFALDLHAPTQNWKFSTGSYYSLDRNLFLIPASPVVTDVAVYAVSIPASLETAGIVAIEKATGKELWTFSPPVPPDSEKRMKERLKDVSRRGEERLTLTVSGQARVYTINSGDRLSSSPAFAQGIVVHGCEDGYVYALDAATGKQKWVFGTQGRIYSSPTIVAGVVYVGSNDGNLYAIDLNTGAERWRFLAGDPITASVTTAAGLIVFGSQRGEVFAIQP
jgi:outer membrane protein assembly factor BamB